MKKSFSIVLMFALAICLSLPTGITFAASNDLNTAAEIQSEIDKVSSSGGGTVTLPAKTIQLDKTISLKSNVHLKGSGIGKTILTTSKADLVKLLTVDRANKTELSNLTLDGNKKLRPSKINSGNFHTMDIAWSDGAKIHDVEFLNAVDAGIALYNASYVDIYNNKLLNGGSNSILGMEDTHHINVLDNHIDKTDHQNGIFFMYQSKSTHDIVIKGNTVKNVADYAIEVGHTTHKVGDAPHRNITIKDNVIENAYCTGIGLRTVSDAVVEGNTIKGYGEAKAYGCNGIFVEGRVEQQKNVDIKDNQIIQLAKNVKKTDSDATPYQQAMYITGMRDMDITGNTITVENPNNPNNKNWSDGIKVIASWGAEGFSTGRREFQDIRVNNNTITNVEVNGISFESAGSTGNTANYNTISKFGGKAISVSGNNVKVEQTGNKVGSVPPPVTPPTKPEEPPVITPEPIEPEAPVTPVTPADPTNLWAKDKTFAPLATGYPKAQRLLIKPNNYVITFDAKSTSGNSKLNVYFDKRESLNQHIKLGTSYTSYRFEFTTKVEQELFFFASDNAKDIHIKNIKLTSSKEIVPDPEPVTGENVWKNPTTINTLAAGYPAAQRQFFDQGDYKITFEAKSTSGNSTLNLYFDKRDSLNQHLQLGTEYKSYSFDFKPRVRQEVFFFAINNAKDISVKNIKFVKVK